MEQPVLKIKKTKKDFIEFLQSIKDNYNVKEIQASFNGSSDSGELESSFILFDKDKQIIDKKLTEDENLTLYDFFEKYLDSTGYDWYNDDGGFGIISLNLETGDITCEMNINEVSYETYDLEDSEFTKKYSF